jgi:hypothetical protein
MFGHLRTAIRDLTAWIMDDSTTSDACRESTFLADSLVSSESRSLFQFFDLVVEAGEGGPRRGFVKDE